jgi:hypothetical protein
MAAAATSPTIAQRAQAAGKGTKALVNEQAAATDSFTMLETWEAGSRWLQRELDLAQNPQPIDIGCPISAICRNRTPPTCRRTLARAHELQR